MKLLDLLLAINVAELTYRIQCLKKRATVIREWRSVTSNTYHRAPDHLVRSVQSTLLISHQIAEERFGKRPSLEEPISLSSRFPDFPRGKYFGGDRSQDPRYTLQQHPCAQKTLRASASQAPGAQEWEETSAERSAEKKSRFKGIHVTAHASKAREGGGTVRCRARSGWGGDTAPDRTPRALHV